MDISNLYRSDEREAERLTNIKKIQKWSLKSTNVSTFE